MIDVGVVVLSDPIIKDEGQIDPAMSLAAIRDDIVASYDLGEPSDWLIAVRPKDLRDRLDAYRPSAGDTLDPLKASESRGVAFQRKSA